MSSARTSIPPLLLLVGFCVSVVGCEETRGALPREDQLPNVARDPAPRFPEASFSESVPVRTKVISNAPSDTITIGNYRGRGGGGGGGAEYTRRRPPGFPRGPHQEPDEMHASARDVVGRSRTRGTEACVLAFEAMRDLQRARQSKTPGRRPPTLDRDHFISSCERRPEIEQWCLIPSYVRENSDECDRRAHTRYARAIERAENRADGEAGDWAPSQDPDETDDADDTPASPTAAPTMGPVHLNP